MENLDMKRNKGEGTQGTKAGVVGLLQNFIEFVSGNPPCLSWGRNETLNRPKGDEISHHYIFFSKF